MNYIYKMRASDFIIFAIILSTSLLSQYSCGYKILAVFPHAGKSHFFVYEPILKELVRRGHELTVISHFAQNKLLINFTDLSLAGAGEIRLNNLPVSKIVHNPLRNLFIHHRLAERGLQNCEALNFPHIKNFIKSKPSFDVILHEHFNTECFLVLNHIFKAPSMGLAPCTVMPWNSNRYGIPTNPSHIPINLLPFSDTMTFWERLVNTVNYILHTYIMADFLQTRPADALIKKYFGDNMPSVEDLARNVSLYLVNSHFSLNKPRPLPPNVIEIAGVHLDKPKPLPPDLEKFISDSEHGVIYFSFGSVISERTISDDVKQAFMDAFSEIPQRVLWKYEDESLPGKPINVLIRKWIPQFDILSHPNVVGFISHGGLLGSIEAFYNGIPIVSIPFLGDQFTNAKALESHGTAIVLDFLNINKETISQALKFILKPSILEKAKNRSRLFRDRPMSPMDTAIWWIEYVARNGGADEIKPAVIHMPFYQSALLDVGLFILFVVVIIVYMNYRLFKLIMSKYFSKHEIKKF